MFARIKSISVLLTEIFRSLPLATWLCVAALGIFLWFWVCGSHGLIEMEHLIRMKRGLILQQATLGQEKQNLETELKWLDDPRYMKHRIHKEMGYVEPGEIIVKFPERQ